MDIQDRQKTAVGSSMTATASCFAMVTAITLSAAAVSQAGAQSSTGSNSPYPSGPPTAQPSCRLDGCTAMEYPQPGGYTGAESGGGVFPCDGYGRSTSHPPPRVLLSCWYYTRLPPSCCCAALCPAEENCQRQSGEMIHVGHTVEKNDILCFSRQDKPTSTPEMVCDVSVRPPPSTAKESTAEESKVEESTVEESTTEESTVESMVEESTVESTVEESTVEESTAEESTTEESTVEESTVEEEEQDPERRPRKLNTRPRQLRQTRAGLAQR